MISVECDKNSCKVLKIKSYGRAHLSAERGMIAANNRNASPHHRTRHHMFLFFKKNYQLVKINQQQFITLPETTYLP